jgi:hypothetical protein
MRASFSSFSAMKLAIRRIVSDARGEILSGFGRYHFDGLRSGRWRRDSEIVDRHPDAASVGPGVRFGVIRMAVAAA